MCSSDLFPSHDNKATAKKTEAEAEKISGADTKVAEREAEMLESQSEFNKRVTKIQDSIEKLTKTQEQKTAAEYFYIQAREKKVWEEVREQIVKYWQIYFCTVS